MKDLSVTKARWEYSRIDSVYEIEKLEPDDIGSYVRHFILPNLQQNYTHAKRYLSNNSRRNIYNIKKHLADLIETQSVVRISTNEDFGSENLSKYEALYLMMESLNLVFFFSYILKSKLSQVGPNSSTLTTLGKLSKLISPVQSDIINSLEHEHMRGCLRI